MDLSPIAQLRVILSHLGDFTSNRCRMSEVMTDAAVDWSGFNLARTPYSAAAAAVAVSGWIVHNERMEDPSVRVNHQVQNLVRFWETVVNHAPAKEIHLITGAESESQKTETSGWLEDLSQSFRDLRVSFAYEFLEKVHDRAIRLSNGWIIKIGRGLDIYQRPDSWFSIGASDMGLRPCLETMVDIFRGGVGGR